MSMTVTEINAATDASLSARTAETAKAAPKPRAAKAAPAKAAAKPVVTKAAATKPVVAKPVAAAKATPAPRKAATPRERAAKPVTATIAAYVAWLERELGRKFTAEQRQLAGISITLYGSYQTSPERRAARSAK
jgi:hypothetical protein